MGKNILAAVLLGLFLFGGTPAEAATSEVAIGSQVELQEVMHRPVYPPKDTHRPPRYGCDGKRWNPPPKPRTEVRKGGRRYGCGGVHSHFGKERGTHVPHLPPSFRR
jgi:hypothetical protein